MEAMDTAVTTTEMAEVDPWAFPANLTARDVHKACQTIVIFEHIFFNATLNPNNFFVK